MSSSNVIRLNNRAVTMLSHGQHKRALNTLRLALANFYQEVQETSQSERSETWPMPDESGHDLVEAAAVAETDYRVHVKSAEIKMQLEQSDTADDDHIRVFNRAMVLSDNNAKNGDVTLVSLLYNLALLSHLRGLQTRCEARFRIALRFYGMAFEIIQGHNDQNIFDDVLVLALVNNLGRTQWRLGNLDDARKQNEFLRSVVGVGSPAASGSSYCPLVDENDYVFFYLNALEDRISAAAA